MANSVWLNDDGSLDPQINDFGAGWGDGQTISGDSITFVTSLVPLTPQSGTADDLKVVIDDDVTVGKLLRVRTTTGNTITIKHLGAAGNIYCTGGADIVLADVHLIIELMYDGTYWVAQTPGTTSVTAPLIDAGGLDAGQTVDCVAAGYVRNWVNAMIDAAYAQLPGSVPLLSAVIMPYFDMVVTVTNPTPINNIAATLATSPLGSQANFDTYFTTFDYDDLQNILFENDGNADGAWGITDIDNVVIDLEALGTVAANVFADIIRAATWVGVNNARSTDVATASPVPCAGWCYAFDFTASDGGWTAQSSGLWSSNATYSAGVGWIQGSVVTYSTLTKLIEAYIGISFSTRTITQIEMDYSITPGIRTPDIFREAIKKSDYTSLQEGSADSGTLTWTGSQALSQINVMILPGYDSIAPLDDPGGSGVITAVRIYGNGINPFGTDNC